MLFTGTLYDLSKLFYKILMSFTEPGYVFKFKMLENINWHFLSGIMPRCLCGTFQINVIYHWKLQQETDLTKTISENGIQADAGTLGD